MNTLTKLTLFFLLVALMPSAVAIVLLLVFGKSILWSGLVLLISLLGAFSISFIVSKSFSKPIEELASMVQSIVNGNFDANSSLDHSRTTQEIEELSNQILLLGNTVTQFRDSVEQQMDTVQNERDAAHAKVAEVTAEMERLHAVTVDRELRMIELKNKLHDAQKRLGEFVPDTHTEADPESLYTIDSDQGKAAMLNLMEDLQREKRTLAAEKAKDDVILRSIGDGLAVANAQGDIVFLNENAKMLLGLSNVDMHHDVWGQLHGIFDPATNKPLTPDDLPLKKAMTGRSVEKQKLFIKNDATPDGRYLSMTATPIIVASVPMGAVAIFRDMTKEQEVDRAKTEFVSLASHQLRTPLSAINWYAEMLLAGDAGELNDEQRKYLNEVYNGNQRMVELINSLLNVSRLELGTFSVDPQDTDVIALAQSVVEEQTPQIKEREIQLSAHLNKQTPHIFADPKLLRMVLQNLISNAVKYTMLGGSVSVTVEPKGSDIAITVSDTGLGIPKEEQGKIFSKLFRATNARMSATDGTGLGLYIVKSVVEHSGGSIWFESVEGKGTTFFVTLPKAGMRKKEGAKSLS